VRVRGKWTVVSAGLVLGAGACVDDGALQPRGTVEPEPRGAEPSRDAGATRTTPEVGAFSAAEATRIVMASSEAEVAKAEAVRGRLAVGEVASYADRVLREHADSAARLRPVAERLLPSSEPLAELHRTEGERHARELAELTAGRELDLAYLTRAIAAQAELLTLIDAALLPSALGVQVDRNPLERGGAPNRGGVVGGGGQGATPGTSAGGLDTAAARLLVEELRTLRALLVEQLERALELHAFLRGAALPTLR
jgi:predicted outer membrane protein